MSATGLPGGTVTFLFTDLRDSTRLWEAHPDEMRIAVRRHDDLVRHAVEGEGGQVVKAMGDGIMAVFADAPSAVAATVALQRQILREDWPIPIAARTGLHTGVAHPDGGDYHSPVVNRAARVANAAHPGQILVTSATAALVDRFELRDLGEREMRGLSPTRVLQVIVEGLPSDFPEAAAPAMRAALPNPATTFVGRADEITALVALIHEHRLVTLAGAGGCGKTRLAIEVAGSVASSFDDGAVFVDLASVTDDGRVSAAVADALGIVSSDTPDAVERLAAYVAGRSLVVVLDNCEHLLDATAELVESLLARGGDSHILTTSREPIAVPGEHVYGLGSLVPETDGVRLFAERAGEASASFAVDEANREAITEICTRLDGIPLAIELAAASVRHLSPAQIVERLDDRFRLLTGGRRRVQRHQTLAAALDWSHDLLSGDEQLVLRRLAVFPATFSLEAAEYVVDRGDTIEILGALVEKSLVNAVSAGDRLRYRLLESVRLYMEQKLVDAGESLVCRARQRDWVVQWLEAVPLEERWFGDRDLLGAEHANIRSAIDWSVTDHDRDAVARLASGVDWARSESWRDGERACLEVLSDDPVDSDLQLQVRMMLWWLGPIRATGLRDLGGSGIAFFTEPAEQVVDSIERWAEPVPLHALALTGYGRDLTIPAVIGSDDELAVRIVDLVEAGIELSARFAPGWRKICCLTAGMAYASLSRIKPADEHFAAGIDVPLCTAPLLLLQSALEGYLAITRLLLGRVDEAVSLALVADERIGPVLAEGAFPYWLHSPGIALPVALGETGDHAAAREALAAYHSIQRRMDFRDGLKSVTVLGGALAAQREDWSTASVLLSAGATWVSRSPADYLLYRRYRDRVRAALPAERARALRAEGREMPIDEAVALALA
jgi:predicted ATPase/class 3 adenylate cyclase